MIQKNLEKILEKIERVSERCGRKKQDIRLIAVTKTVPIENITEAIQNGIQDLGESRIQESQNKIHTLQSFAPSIQWHFIGHLQSNKVQKAVEGFNLIQSVDSFHLAKRIHQKAEQLNKIQNCLAEIKISNEPSKSGLPIQELELFLEQAQQLKNIKISGLMCVPPLNSDPNAVRPYFQKARKCYEQFFLNSQENPILSMGMSNDFETAIEEGSTMIRIGSALFGNRPSNRIVH